MCITFHVIPKYAQVPFLGLYSGAKTTTTALLPSIVVLPTDSTLHPSGMLNLYSFIVISIGLVPVSVPMYSLTTRLMVSHGIIFIDLSTLLSSARHLPLHPQGVFAYDCLHATRHLCYITVLILSHFLYAYGAVIDMLPLSNGLECFPSLPEWI